MNRGWIGENEELNKTNANKIAKNYKDKWQIDNNIKVDFVDGLTINGEAVEGNTSATRYLGKKSKGKTTQPNITIKIDSNSQNPYAVLRSEFEHARDYAVGNKKGIKNEPHTFPRYDAVPTEDALAVKYVQKKSTGRAKALNRQQEIENINNNVKQYEADGYQFKQAENDGWGDNRIELTNKEGQNLGFVEYSIKDNVLEINEIRGKAPPKRR